MSAAEPAWIRRFRAARVSLPAWAHGAPERLSYATNASGVWQVWSWDRAADIHTQLTDKPTGVIGSSPTVDGSGVVWFDDHAGDEVGRFLVTPFGGGTPQPLVPDAPDGWSEGLSMRAGRIAVGVSDDAGFALFVADGDGTREVYRHTQPASVGGLSEDASLLAVSHTEHGDTLHPALRILTPDGEAAADLWDGKGNTVSPGRWSPVSGDPLLAVHADRSGRTRPELWNPVTSERRSLAIDLPGEVWVADWWPDGSALLLGHDHLGRTSLHRYDLAADALTAIEVGDGTIRGARIRPDGTLWYAFSSASTPAQVRARAADGADETLLRAPGEVAPDGVPYRSLHFANPEGQQVHAFLAEPPGERPHPLVVMVHGGPHAQDQDTFDPSVQAWVDHGYAVLLPNYRGSTGYGKEWEDALEGDPGRPELEDCLAGRDALIEQGVARGGQVVLTGASWGGYLTLLGLGTQPESWDVGVAVVPVADYLAAYEDESPALREFDRSLFGGTPDEVGDLYRERSPLTHVDRVRAPVLIITGANDTRCPKRQVDNYVEALQARGHPHNYDVFEAGHGSLAVEETIREHLLALDFAAEHLGTPEAQRS